MKEQGYAISSGKQKFTFVGVKPSHKAFLEEVETEEDDN